VEFELLTALIGVLLLGAFAGFVSETKATIEARLPTEDGELRREKKAAVAEATRWLRLRQGNPR
jgi:hypothetical protein